MVILLDLNNNIVRCSEKEAKSIIDNHIRKLLKNDRD